MKSTVCLIVLACGLCLTGCANAIVRPVATTVRPAPDAFLVLPGFGYGSAGEKAFRTLARSAAAEGFDVYVPRYVSRSGLDQSRDRLQRFIREQRLDRYQRVHVFAFLAGAWTINPLIETEALPNLASVIYDRSPYQERAPRIALDRLRFLAWLRYGSVVFDVARQPYPPATRTGVRVGLVVETEPTGFVQRFSARADRQGPYQFDCDGLGQPHDDCLYAPMNHDELYSRFAELWPEIHTFVRTGRFGATANRAPPSDVVTAGGRR